MGWAIPTYYCSLLIPAPRDKEYFLKQQFGETDTIDQLSMNFAPKVEGQQADSEY